MKKNPKSKTFSRWELAQNQQKQNQLRKKNKLRKLNLKPILQSRSQLADSIFFQLGKYKDITPETRILEVGSGPHGINFFHPNGRRISLDPLAGFFYKEFDFMQKNSHSLLVQGMGEFLPFSDKSIDVVICDNVLDHTLDSKKILSEIHRVLKDDGLFYLANHLHHFIFRIFSLIFKILYSIKLVPNTPNYKAHTYFFTPGMFTKMIKKSSFSILYEKISLSKHQKEKKSLLFKPFKNIYSTFICTKKKK
jgi:ubiquinone/menaquinone biosynthesis C-methylase UbiE